MSNAHWGVKWDFNVTVFQPQFESLFKKGQTSETSSIKPSSEHLSYAQFIVQSKSNAAAAPPREGPSNLPTTEDAAETNLNQKEAASASCAPGGHQRVQEMEKDGFTKLSEAPPENSTKHNDGTCSDPSHPQGPKPVGCGSSIVVSPRQVGIKMITINARSLGIKHTFFFLEGESYPEVCQECPMGVWRCCSRLRFRSDHLCSLPQVCLPLDNKVRLLYKQMISFKLLPFFSFF